MNASPLSFAVADIRPEPYTVTPTLMARVAIQAEEPTPVHAIALRAQVRLEPHRRAYNDDEAAGLLDLFGPRERWHETQRSFLWLQCATMVSGFTGETEVDLPLPCSYDFEVAAAKYLHALGSGTVPLVFLFSGTVFFAGDKGFAVQQVPWDRDDTHDMPVAVWRELMGAHFPGAGWVRLSRTTMDTLSAVKAERGLLTFDDTVSGLLASSRAGVVP